jgi:hypothetical protein
MAKKTEVAVKRQLLALYNDLTETVKSKKAALSEILDPEERQEAEGVLKKFQKKQKKAEADALDSDGE